MDPQFIQTIRYKLQRRVRRLASIGWPHFDSALRRTWPFIRRNKMFMAILEPALRYRGDLEETAAKLIDGEPLDTTDELEAVGVAFHMIDRLHANPQLLTRTLHSLGARRGWGSNLQDFSEHFCTEFVEPLYEYLDEALDDQRATVGLLTRYKHRCEWFDRDRLRQIADKNKNGRPKERPLAMDLYRYLHDQGMDFHIEPRSASGEVDFIENQVGESRLILDAKVFDPSSSRGKSYLVKGFQQVCTYAQDYNEGAAYLAIFQVTPTAPRFMFARGDSRFPYVTHNGKVIYFAVIDIADYEGKSASKRDKQAVVEITERDLFAETTGDEAG